MFDVIIATNNGTEIALKLSYSIIGINSNFLNKVIIVDSSDREIEIESNHTKLLYVRTKHKNQPYQRFLGYNISSSKYLLFLDDDMELIKNSIFEDCMMLFKERNIAGINLKFIWDNKSLNRIQKDDFNFFKNSAILNMIAGSPRPTRNKYIFCGIRGERVFGDNIEYLAGGCFVIKRSCAYKNF